MLSQVWYPVDMQALSDGFYRNLIDIAEEQGWEVSRTRRGHLKMKSPNGNVVFHSGTPSDWRAVHNFVAKLRRNGLVIPRRQGS